MKIKKKKKQFFLRGWVRSGGGVRGGGGGQGGCERTIEVLLKIQKTNIFFGEGVGSLGGGGGGSGWVGVRVDVNEELKFL